MTITNQDLFDKLEDVLDKLADNKELLQQAKSVQTLCNHCGGDGMKDDNGGTITCPDCGGNGLVPSGRITLTSEE